MTDPSGSPEQLGQLSAEVARYIKSQRDKYRPAGLPLSSEQRNAMFGYFSSDLLFSVRWLSLISELVETPTFFVMGLDLVDPSAFTMMAAITFSDVIVANVPLWNDILFHELVHCEQYRQLGIERFAEIYAKGYVESGYHGVPLEEHAYMLGTRFELNRNEPFSVEQEVATWIAETRF
jgi:hypothetical protein